MKMVTTLISNESGIITYAKRPVAVLEADAVLANLELDNPNLVTKAVLYKGKTMYEIIHTKYDSKLSSYVKTSQKLFLLNISKVLFSNFTDKTYARNKNTLIKYL